MARLEVIPSSGGPPIYQSDWPIDVAPRRAAERGALEYVSTRDGTSNIWRQKLAGGPPEQITNYKSGMIFDFAWSCDGKQLGLIRGGQTSDVIMISNFR